MNEEMCSNPIHFKRDADIWYKRNPCNESEMYFGGGI